MMSNLYAHYQCNYIYPHAWIVNNPPINRGLEKALVDQTQVAIPTLVVSVEVLT